MYKLRLIYLFVFFAVAKFSFCQEPIPGNKIEDKVVIDFPGITTSQLNSIKTEFLKYDQIVDAKFISGVHNCMLITFDQNQHNFTVYAELLKPISIYYNTAQCYFKVKSAYAEITANIGTDTVFEVK